MSHCKVALAQMWIVLGQPEENLRSARAALVQAKDEGAELVLLPELWSTGYDLERAREHGSPIDAAIFARMSEMAREFELHLCGSALEARDGRSFNTQALFAPDGRLVAAYSKIHLFGLMHEPDFLAPGTQLQTAQTPWGKAGLAICYDLRFPEMFRAYALGGAGLLLLSAEWPHPRLEHWRTLIRARAIENQSFFAACNCVGESNGNIFFGHSMIVDPWGEVLIEAGERAGVFIAEIDLARVEETRRRLPVFADRRAGIYSLP